MMEFVLGALLIIGIPSAGVSTYLASVPCRLLLSRHRRPGWHIAFAVSVVVGGLAVLLLGGTDLFHPSQWDRGKVSFMDVAWVWFEAAFIGALIPAWYVVAHHREKL